MSQILKESCYLKLVETTDILELNVSYVLVIVSSGNNKICLII